MKTTTVFRNGGSQAVRIPKELQLDGKEVYIKRVAEGLLLVPKKMYAELFWAEWAAKLEQYDELIAVERGGEPQVRDGIDEIFP